MVFPSAVRIPSSLGGGHEVFSESCSLVTVSSNEIVGVAKGAKPRGPGGAAGAAKRWQSGGDETRLVSQGCQMATKREMEVRCQGCSMGKDAARNSGHLRGQR